MVGPPNDSPQDKGEVWPSSQVLKKISVYIAGEIVVSENPGNVLRKWREFFGASQLEVAKYMGVSSSVISDYEKGRRAPGSIFIKRFINALLDIDATRGWPTVGKLARMLNLHYLGAVIDMEEFEQGIPLSDIVNAVKGVPLSAILNNIYVYGYTVVDSIKAIMSLNSDEFLALLGSTTQRVIVFTKVSTGRSPMIALRVTTIKPAAIVMHGTMKVDPLALWIIGTENVPVILSTARNVSELVEGLRKLVSSPR